MNPILAFIIHVIHIYFHEPYASLLEGVTYGVPIQLGPTFKTQILRSGLTHLVVLSGANITILVAAMETVFSHLDKKIGMILNIMCVGCFTAVVGLQAPLLRALIMFAASSYCIFTGRPTYVWWNLWLSVFFVAVIRPDWITSISFLLSFTATVGLISSDILIHKIPFSFPELVQSCMQSIIVFLFTLPLSVIVFRSFSLMSPFATVAASLLVLPLMAGGLALPLLHLVFPPLAVVLSYPLTGLLMGLTTIIERSSAVPFGFIQW
jgi:competence protein ComEC